MKTYSLRVIAVTFMATAAFSLPMDSLFSRGSGGVAHAMFVGKIGSVGKKVGRMAKGAVDLMKKAPQIMKTLLKDGPKFVRMAARSVKCFAKGMKNLAKDMISNPLKATVALAKRAMSAVGDWVRKSPGDLIREIASSGRELLGIVRSIKLGGNLSMKGLLRIAGELATKAFKAARGLVDRQYQLFFKRLATAKDIWPLGCILEAKPVLDRVYKPLVHVALDKIVGVVKDQYEKGIVKKLPPIIEKAISMVTRKFIDAEALDGAYIARLIAADRTIVDVLKGKEVELNESSASRLNSALDALPFTKASFWLEALRSKTVDKLLDKALDFIRDKLKDLVDVVGLKVSGIILPIFDVIAGEIGGLVAPLILQVVTVEVATVGAVGSILTAAIAQVVMGVLTGVWNIVWKWGVAEPLKRLIAFVFKQISKLVKGAVGAVSKLVGGSLDAIIGAVRTRLASKIQMPGIIDKLLGAIATVIEKLGGPRIEALKKHFKNLQGLIGDLAAKKGKICNASFPADAVKEPPMDTFDMQGKLINWLLDKILGAGKGRAKRASAAAEGPKPVAGPADGPAAEGAGPMTNLALRRPAYQSSGAHGGAPQRAVDGKNDGQYFHHSVTHTRGELQPWWQVDLGRMASIEKVRIWNRTDCCSGRLSNFSVLVSDRPFRRAGLAGARKQAVFSTVHRGPAPRMLEIAVGKQGRFVRIQLNGRAPLSLAEVEVLGK